MKYKTINVKKRFNPLTICSLPLVLVVASCGDSSNLGNIDSDLAAGEDVAVNIATDEDGNVVVGSLDTGEDSAAVLEARALLDGLAADGGTPFDVNNPVEFPEDYNLFIPSITGVDLNLISDENPSGPTARLPMFRGLDPRGNSVDYVITESSDQEVAELMGIIFAPRQAAEAGSPGTQSVTIENGIMQFEGSVDFSPTRFVTAGDPTVPGTNPGAIADGLWSSYVVLPSGVVLNAQLVANATGIHDRIPDSGQDDQNNPNPSTL